jgi:peptidylprolyl isomerase
VIKHTHLAALLVTAAIAVAGCGGSGTTTTAAIPAGPAPTAPPPPKASTNLQDTKSKPVVPKQTGAPPKKLVVKDIVVGKGKAAKKGDMLSMQYVGVHFQLGQGKVIPGWDKGLVGIKPGGRRELIIPGKLAYGAQGQPPTIPPNAALVFIVDALSVSGP